MIDPITDLRKPCRCVFCGCQQLTRYGRCNECSCGVHIGDPRYDEMRASNDPAFAATDEGQEALARAHRRSLYLRRPVVSGGMSSVPYSGGENDLLDPGEAAMLAYQRESR